MTTSHTPFTAVALQKGFGRKSAPARSLIPALLAALPLADGSQPHLPACVPLSPELPAQVLCRVYKQPSETDAARLLFVTQTYYTLVIKRLLLAFLHRDPHDPTDWIRGTAFTADGLSDPAPCRCYDWPATRLTPALIAALGSLDAITAFTFDDPPPDALKTLYHDLFPRQIRHRLAEYYTPDWLAQYLLERVGLQPGMRLN